MFEGGEGITQNDGKWHWRYAILATAILLVLVGVAPLAYLVWDGSGNSIEPLSMPLSLAPGEYQSAPFVPSLNEDHQIQLYFLPANRTPFKLAWKIVDNRGQVLQTGSYQDHDGGNNVELGQYRPPRGVRQRAIVDVLEGHAVPGDVRLHIGVPEESLSQSYAMPLAEAWCLLLAGAGVILFVIYAISQGRANTLRKTPPLNTAAG